MRSTGSRNTSGSRRSRVWELLATLHPEDLLEGGAAHLELLVGGLARSDRALDLEAGPAHHARDRGVRVALAPGEHLHRHRGAPETDRRLGSGASQSGPADPDVAHGRGPRQPRHTGPTAAAMLRVPRPG